MRVPPVLELLGVVFSREGREKRVREFEVNSKQFKQRLNA
jgi:hypothetical protein